MRKSGVSSLQRPQARMNQLDRTLQSELHSDRVGGYCQKLARHRPSGRAFPQSKTSVNFYLSIAGGSSSAGRASDCGSESRGFKSRLPPQPPSLRSALILLISRSGLCSRRQILIHLSALHHEYHAPHRRRVPQRIAVHRNDVRLHPGTDGANFVLHPQ